MDNDTIRLVITITVPALLSLLTVYFSGQKEIKQRKVQMEEMKLAKHYDVAMRIMDIRLESVNGIVFGIADVPNPLDKQQRLIASIVKLIATYPADSPETQQMRRLMEGIMSSQFLDESPQQQYSYCIQIANVVNIPQNIHY
jgi:hypothetical protein